MSEPYWCPPGMLERVINIRDHPEKHHHKDLNELQQCCWVEEIRAIDLTLVDAHAKYAPLGSNGGQPCDVRYGPCSCGAWH